MVIIFMFCVITTTIKVLCIVNFSINLNIFLKKFIQEEFREEMQWNDFPRAS